MSAQYEEKIELMHRINYGISNNSRLDCTPYLALMDSKSGRVE